MLKPSPVSNVDDTTGYTGDRRRWWRRGGGGRLFPGRWNAVELPLTLLTVIVLFGSHLRLSNLDEGDFGVDELYQVFAAESIARGEGPRVPSGELYRRGVEVTRVVQLSFRHLGQSEYAARLPSAVFGVLSLVLFSAVLWLLGGPWAAVVGAALFAVYPEAVQQSRSLRFYTYQLSLGVCALYTGWRALQHSGHSRVALPVERLRTWGWVVATLVLLLLAARAQIVTLSVAAGWAVCVLCAAALDLRRQGRAAWRSSVPLQLSAAGALLIAAIAMVRTDVLNSLMLRAQALPFWVITDEGSTTPLAYYYSLASSYPLLLGLLPLIFLGAIMRRPWLGVYLTLWFAVPLLLHSFWLPWKGPRFVLIPMLGLFAATSIAAAWGAGLLRRYLTDRVKAYPRLTRFGSAAATAAVVLIALMAFVTLPAFHQARKLPSQPGTTQWSISAEILQARPDLHQLPWGQTRPLHPLYYWGKLDFLVNRGRLAQIGPPDARGQRQVNWLPGGSPDRTSGVPVFASANDLRKHFAGYGAVIIGVDTGAVSRGLLDRDLVQALTEDADELCQGRCGPMRLYHWRFESSATEELSVPRWEGGSSES
jgi:hypothetical protein